jgi:hypothetical protein
MVASIALNGSTAVFQVVGARGSCRWCGVVCCPPVATTTLCYPALEGSKRQPLPPAVRHIPVIG